MDILELAGENQKKARKVILDLKLVEVWESVGAKANLVGSLRTGLLMKNYDIDFHIYSDKFKLDDSFSAISKLAKNQSVKQIDYKNLLNTEEECLEWHIMYEDENKDIWQIDMIHIIKDSKYAGYFKKVADKISEVLTPETKLAILTIKNDTPENVKIPGIKIYKAVIAGGIRTYDEFLKWQEQQNDDYIIEWIP